MELQDVQSSCQIITSNLTTQIFYRLDALPEYELCVSDAGSPRLTWTLGSLYTSCVLLFLSSHVE